MKLKSLVKEHFYKILYLFIILSFILLIFVYLQIGARIFIKSLLYFIPLISFLLIITKYNKKLFNIFSTSLQNFSFVPIIITKRLSQITLFNLLLVIIGYLMLAYYPSRNLLYLIIVSLSGTILFIQVIFTRNFKAFNFFFQATLISLGLTWGVTLKYPLFFGYSDIIAHLSFTNTIIQQGISSLPIIGYRYFPLYHTFLAIGKTISGLSLQTNYFIILGLISICFLFLSYLIINHITKDKKISFIYTLFFLFSREIIFGSRYLVTRNVAVILTLFILYLLLRRSDKNRIYFTSLILLFSLSLILTHHLTTLLFLLVLIMLLLVKTFINYQRKIFRNILNIEYYIILLGVSFSAYWMYVSREFTRHLSLTFKESMLVPLTMQSTDIEEKIAENITTFTGSIKSLLGNLDYMVIIFLSLFGISFLISQWTQIKKYVKLFSILGLLSIPFVIPNPISWQFNTEFLIYRIPMITIIFWIILPLIGFLVFIKLTISNKNKKKIQPLILCGVISFTICFTAIANVSTSDDVKAISIITQGEPSYFSDLDLLSFSFCNLSIPTKSSCIISDRFSILYLNQFYQLLSIDVNKNVSEITKPIYRNSNVKNLYLLYSSLIYLEFKNAEYLSIRDTINQILYNDYNLSKIYDNNVSLYYEK